MFIKQVHFVKTDDIRDKMEVLFVTEKRKLEMLFPSAQIEHVGGTCFKGTITKGDLDISIRIDVRKFKKIKEILKNLYQINQPDNWTETFASFKDDARNLGIQVTVLGSPNDYFVAQRDYLKNHSEAIMQYNALKERFEGKSMNEYRKEKNAFFEKLNRSLSRLII